MKYKAILYDIDGTILNTLDMNMYPLIKIIKEELNEEWTYNQVLKFACYPGMKVMDELKIKDKEKVYQRWVQYVNEYPCGALLYDGFEEVFQTFHGQVKQGIVTSKKKKQYQIDFVSKGLDRYIDIAVLEEDTQHHKPHPEPILKCLEQLNVKKEEAIYIGDTLSDLQAAQNAGIDFGLAKWGCTSDQGFENADFIFETPIDLLSL